eukprot:c28114_g2_i1 orf=439-2334(+)
MGCWWVEIILLLAFVLDKLKIFHFVWFLCLIEAIGSSLLVVRACRFGDSLVAFGWKSAFTMGLGRIRLLIMSAVGILGNRCCPAMQQSNHLRRALRNKSRAGFVCRLFLLFNLSQGSLAARVLLRSLFFSMILASLSILFLVTHMNPCEREGNGDDWNVGTDQIVSSGSLQKLSSIGSSQEFSSTMPEYNAISYEEYIQIQLKKTQYLKLKKLWTTRAWRKKVEMFSDVLSDILDEQLLRPTDKSLCVGAGSGEVVMAMKEIGVQDAIGIDLVSTPPLVIEGDVHRQPFANGTFDFEFSSSFDESVYPALFVAEIERTLKPGGVAAVIVSLSTWREKNLLSEGRPVDPVTLLFKESKIVYVTKTESPGFDTVIVFRKRCYSGHESSEDSGSLFQSWNCSLSRQKEAVLSWVEPLITQEPTEEWILSRNYLKNVKYLPNLLEVDNGTMQFYVDVGAGDFDSSIGSWFMEHYPKTSNRFNIFAIEPDRSLEASYTHHSDVEFLPYLAWIRNESIILRGSWVRDSPSVSGVSPEEGMMNVQALDFSEWLKKTVSVDNFVVVKMDVGGLEFELLQQLFETGAICLIDELFLACHRNGTRKILSGTYSKHENSYGECIALYALLRHKGVVAHQWWW